MARKKIFLVSTMVLPLPDVEGGAIERLITMLIEQNEKYGLVDLVVISIYNEKARYISTAYKNTRIIHKKRCNKLVEKLFMYTYVVFNKFFKIKLPYFDPNYLCLPKLVENEKPDYISMEGSGGENCVSLLRYMNRNKLYLHLHHMYSTNDVLDKTFGNIISASKFIEDNWAKAGHKDNYRSEILYNCIDSSRFAHSIKDKYTIRKELSYAQDEFIVLFCGRIVEEKGVKELIEAFLQADINKGRLLIVGCYNAGSNPDMNYYNQIVNMCNKENNIDYIGYIDNEKIRDYYMLSDILVIPSLCEEAAGLVAIEGMACGTPIVASRSGGMPEYLGSAAIIVEKEGIIENLTKQLNSLSKDSELRERLSLLGKKRAEMFYEERYYFEFMKIFGIGN